MSELFRNPILYNQRISFIYNHHVVLQRDQQKHRQLQEAAHENSKETQISLDLELQLCQQDKADVRRTTPRLPFRKLLQNHPAQQDIGDGDQFRSYQPGIAFHKIIRISNKLLDVLIQWNDILDVEED